MVRTHFILVTILFWSIFFCFSRQLRAEAMLKLSPSSPINTSSGVSGSMQCTKSSDESYAACASMSNTAVKYNLQPFSFAAKGPNQGKYMQSCDLFETASQSTSQVICARGTLYPYSNGVVYFHRVSDMINVTNVTIGSTGNYPHVIIDTPNQVAYASNNNYPPAIYKITNISGSNPIFAATLSTFGSGDYNPVAMLIIDGLLYLHFYLDPARLARINISSFTWNKTVTFATGELNGICDNLANDDNFIYDLTANGILVRCTYKNNNFSRFDSLNTGFSSTASLAISPDSSFLLLTAAYSGILLVNTSTFSVESRALLPNPTSTGYASALGRPIILSTNNTTNNTTNTYPVLAFSRNDDYVYAFNDSRVQEVFPTIYPLPNSPINISSGEKGSLQCSKNSDESYAVCGSSSNRAIKYNLRPFAFAAKGPNQGDSMNSCDLYETSSESTSRAVCVKVIGDGTGAVYFHRVSDMIDVTSVAIGTTADAPHVAVDTPNQVAYISNSANFPRVYKIISIGSSTPIVAATLSTFGSGDYNPVAMLIIDGFLYVHFYLNPSRLARINLLSFTWNKTVAFPSGEYLGQNDNLANDDNFIYDLTYNGFLVRCTYKNNNFSRFDSLNTGLSSTGYLAISPNQRTLFVVSYGSSLLQLINTTSFSMFGNVVTVPSAWGRPIITSSCHVYAFRWLSELVYAFRLNSSDCRTLTAIHSSLSRTNSASTQRTRTSTVSAENSASISTSIPPKFLPSTSNSTSTSTSISDSPKFSSSASTSTSTSNSASISPKFLPSRSASTSTSSSTTMSPKLLPSRSTSTSTSNSSSISPKLLPSRTSSTSNSNSTAISPKFLPSRTTSTSTSISISNSNSGTNSAKKTSTTSETDTRSNTRDESSSTSKMPKRSRSSSRDDTSSSSVTPTRTQSFEPTATKTTSNSTTPSFTRSQPELLLTVSKAVPRVDPVPALPGLTDASSSAGAIAAFAGVGAVAAQQNRLAAVASLIRCGDAEGLSDVKPDYISSPFQLRLGDDVFGWHRGLLVGNIFVLLSFTCVVVVIAFVYSNSIGKCDFQTALLHLRFPGIVMLPTSILMPPSAEKAVALFWFSEGSGGKDFFLAIFCGSVLVFAPCVLTLFICHVSAKGRLDLHTEHVEQGEWIGKIYLNFVQSSVYKTFQYLTQVQFEFTDGKHKSDHEENIINLSALLNDNNNNNSNNNEKEIQHHMSKLGKEGAAQFLSQNPWFARVGTIMESFSLFYFAFVDAAVSAILGFTAGTAAGTASFPQCVSIFSINIICCLTHLFLLLRYRGVTPRYLLIYMTAASAITLVAVVLALLQYMGKLLHAGGVWEYLELVQVILGFFVAILSLIGFLDFFCQLFDFYFSGIFRRGKKNDNNINDGEEDRKSKDFGASREMLNLLDDNFVIDIEEELRNLPSSPPIDTVTHEQHVQDEESIDFSDLLVDLEELENGNDDEEIHLGILLGNSTSTNAASHTVEVFALPEMTEAPIPENNKNKNDSNDPNLLYVLDEADRETKEKEKEIITRRLASASRGNHEMVRNQNELQKMFGRDNNKQK